MSKITVSEKAQNYFREIISKQKIEGLAIRLTVTNPNTPGVECGILYCPKEYITPSDEHFKMDGFEVVIDQNAMFYLMDSVIDLGEEDGEAMLTFHAPNLKKSVLPDNATLKERINLFFDSSINPALAGHGGSATVVDVTEDGIVKVAFAGGCNGCSMVGATLKDGIEVQLNNAFPGMIKEIVDVTAHEVTEETYA